VHSSLLVCPMDDQHDFPPRPALQLGATRWQVAVALQDMKFSAAHFVAFEGFREPLHGHNYTVGARLGSSQLQADGYVVDFGDLKKVVRGICKKLDQHTLLPSRSNVLQIQQMSDAPLLEVQCEGGVRIMLPEQDCILLPIVHTTAEELAEYIATEIISKIGSFLQKRRCEWLEVQVSERPGQGACHLAPLRPEGIGIPVRLERRVPRPCMVPVSSMDDPVDEVIQDLPREPSSEMGFVASQSHSLTRPHRPQIRRAANAAHPQAEEAFQQLLSTLGPEESSRPELVKTPYRAAKAFKEMTRGIHVKDPLEAVGDGVFEVEGARDLVAVRDIPFHSLCEHHLLPFSGTAHIAYFPDGRVLGLSKFARLIEVFARRLQLQERLTQQFVDAVDQLLSPRAVAVSLEAHHACMSHRGASVPSSTRTIAMRGPEKDNPLLKEQLLLGVSRSGAASARL